MKAALVFALLVPDLAQAACRQALALGLDVSGSVDATEYRLQLDGVARALESPNVQAVLFAPAGAAVDIAVYEWSGQHNQTIILPWTTLDGQDSLLRATTVLRTHARAASDQATAIGSAMQVGFALLEDQQHCWKLTLDMSGDGPANSGPLPENITAHIDRIVVNGLVIGSDQAGNGDDRFADIKELSSYYRTRVARGPGAFVETALGFNDFAVAMERKLMRELQSIATSDAGQLMR
jgi:hypothetical protein